MDSKLHICFCLDSNWVTFAMRAIYDIIIRKYPETRIKFYILLDNFKCDTFYVFNSIEGIEVVTKTINTVQEFGLINKVSKSYLGPFKHLKFLIPELDIFKDVKRVLYLDVDILARRDLTELYHTDLDGYALGGIKSYMNMTCDDFITYPEKYNEIESSVILMDLPKLRTLHFTDTCKALALSPICNGDFWIWQAACKNMIKLLDPKVEIPYHILSVGNDALNNIAYWNLFYGSHYKSVADLILRSYLWHFNGDKEKMYTDFKSVKCCFDVSRQRLQDFIKFGTVMPWTPEDDYIFYSQRGMFEKKEEQANENKTETVDAEPVLE